MAPVKAGAGRMENMAKLPRGFLFNYKTEVTENGITVNIEPSELVTCEECIHKEETQPGMVYCPNIVGGWVPNEFFCGHGEQEDA